MARIIDFPVKTIQKVSLLPSVFTNLLEMYKNRQDELKRKKINFLHQQAFQYFYDVLETPAINAESVDLPNFIYDEQRKKRAYDRASKALLDVIKNNSVDFCYSKRVKKLKKLGVRVRLNESL